jgi:hypothetical protein
MRAFSYGICCCLAVAASLVVSGPAQAQLSNAGALSLPSGISNSSSNVDAVRAGIASGGWTVVYGNYPLSLAQLNASINATASNGTAMNGYFPRVQTGASNPLAIALPIPGAVTPSSIDDNVAKLVGAANAAQLRAGLLRAIRARGNQVVVRNVAFKGGIATYTTYKTVSKQVQDGVQTVTMRVPDGVTYITTKVFGKTIRTPVTKFKTVTQTVPKYKTVTEQVADGQINQPYYAFKRR